MAPLEHDNQAVDVSDTCCKLHASADQLVQLANQEIQRVRDDNRQPGWTPWALVGALASALWLFLSSLERSPVRWNQVLALYLVLALIFEGISRLSGLLDAGPARDSKHARFWLAHTALGSARHYFALELCHTAFLLSVPIICELPFGWLASGGIYLYYGQRMVGLVLVLVFSFTRLPIHLRLRASRTRDVLSWTALSALLVVAIIAVSTYITEMEPSPGFGEWRVAGLLCAIALLLLLLAKSRAEPPLLGPLVDMRRDLVLGRMDLDSARRQLDLALTGLEVGGVLQEHVAHIVRTIGTVEELLETARQELLLLATRVEKGDATREARTIAEALCQAASAHVD